VTGPELTARDCDVLRLAGRLGLVTAGQLERLYFPSAQAALRRLRRLRQGGYVARLHLPGMPLRVATLTPRGAEAVAEDGAVVTSARALRCARPRGPLFVAHALAVGDFYVTLVLACRRHTDVTLREFLPATISRGVGPRTPPTSQLQSVTATGSLRHGLLRHVPDAAFVLERGGNPALFLLEADRGTETIGEPARGVGKIIRCYLNALADGGHGAYEQLFGLTEPLQVFRALVVTTTPARVENIRRRWSGESCRSPLARRFIWLSGSTALSSPDLFTHPWTPLDHADASTYSILPAPQEGPTP
jgi:hypothetical protein